MLWVPSCSARSRCGEGWDVRSSFVWRVYKEKGSQESWICPGCWAVKKCICISGYFGTGKYYSNLPGASAGRDQGFQRPSSTTPLGSAWWAHISAASDRAPCSAAVCPRGFTRDVEWAVRGWNKLTIRGGCRWQSLTCWSPLRVTLPTLPATFFEVLLLFCR